MHDLIVKSHKHSFLVSIVVNPIKRFKFTIMIDYLKSMNSYTRCLKVWPGEPGVFQISKPCEALRTIIGTYKLSLWDMSTNARCWLLACFLAKTVNNQSIFSASPLCEGWHGFLQKQGNLDQKLAKNQPCVHRFLKKIGNFGENFA